LAGARRVVLVSGHYVGSKRRAGFHWIADAFREAGWHVTFVTVGFSQLSRLKNDHRFQYALKDRANRLETIGPALDSYVWFTPFHPLNRLPAALQLISWPLFATYGRLPMPGIDDAVAEADLIVFESTSGLMLVPRFRRWSPTVRMVYRVSDSLLTLRAHPVVLAAERRALPEFSLVSVPSVSMLAPFMAHHNTRVQHHGIRTDEFDQPVANPYGPGPRAVFVGAAYLDVRFLEIASASFPDWQFHVIGPLENVPRAPNVIAHGELPFAETVPFIAHADVGLAALSSIPGAESFSDSLKIIQYTCARLPIVAPDFLRSARTNVFTYRPGDPASIREAMLAARGFDRSTVDRTGIGSWRDLARNLAGPELWP